MLANLPQVKLLLGLPQFSCLSSPALSQHLLNDDFNYTLKNVNYVIIILFQNCMTDLVVHKKRNFQQYCIFLIDSFLV